MADKPRKDQSRVTSPTIQFGHMKESPEFDPRQLAPLGVPGNPLEGTPGSQDAVRPQHWWFQGTSTPGNPQPGRLEQTGISDAGAVAGGKQIAQSPEQLLVPDVVSATDPAYSAHPTVQRAIQGLGRVPAASPTGDSPWTLYRKPGALTGKGLYNALSMGTKGMDLPYADQGIGTIMR